MGLDYDLFWRLVPKEIIAIIDGQNARIERDHKLQQVQFHDLAVLISFAYHDPKNMPEPPGNTTTTKKKEVSSPVDDERVRGFFMAMAMRNEA
ncbi:hypothetical protein [Sulfitobacter sp. SH24]|uniref:hypothetical protein n=1 Tax=Sulfitobacter sp. SH24 TaxID=3421173 RepID=UPI003F4F9657